MRKNLTIIASILLVIGGAALCWVLAEERKDSEQAAHYKSNYSTERDDYVKRYNEWLQTPPQERAELPLLLDENGKIKTREQLWQEQQGRLRADLDKLATGEITAPPSFADVLYGESWQTELSEYDKRKERQAFVFTGSIVCTSMGGLVYAWWLLLWAGRLVVKAASGLKRSFRRLRCTAGQNDQEKPEPADAEDVLPEQKAGEQQGQPAQRARISVKPVTPPAGERECRPMGSVTQRPRTTREREKITVLMSDEKSSDTKTSTGGAREFQAVPEQSKPIDSTLTDLTQQVSAIREYAASQQDRLEKLQDGYDWNIIRTFCLRVIRAVDNLESQIAQLKDEDAETTHLEQVRDELIFALESSGIEQFEPETDSEYRGQERSAEAIKEKQGCDDPEQAGKIANVIRPGYQYFINEGNVKIVRPAQVRLYA
ncbi:MAG: nucleotide exchange factor GrpE [Phycisphaerae bacterium]|nr:nucleotide exchange factor GrpE [Phycisphaerae bacterium]